MKKQVKQTMKAILSLSCGLFINFTLISCMGANSSSDVAIDDSTQVTGRLSMGDYDPYQCYSLSKGGKGTDYTASEKVNGYWIAGLDGKSLGTVTDGKSPEPKDSGKCGKTFSMINKKTGQSEKFIVADRIWENDGDGGCRYQDKGLADRKDPNCTQGKGGPQLDIAKQPFYSLFGGHNPKPEDVEIKWDQSPGEIQSQEKEIASPIIKPSTVSKTSLTPKSSAPSILQKQTSTGFCDYSKAGENNGWGWNDTTKQSCPPKAGTGAPAASTPTSQGICDYSKAAENNGWGWNDTTKQSCPPK